ncbi:uncharacterized protein F5147DRAFT_763570 [Suillus discolor]|uniref:C2H2-type domain-containing protein n=1 Tax=Suillus discolor TaxID=1912936 RepID=A0A9P7EYP1_9AGAM|nr:uncharacterized protein F5147DRAFT_763570 [Suillus discolor]KAG2096353.1 hypothetical protein F5147DRAFT_763570 [Suillus discolor]
MDVHSRPESSLPTPQLTSSSRLGNVPDQDLTRTRSSLQSCLECLDRVHDRMDCVYKEFLEIRTRITELLVTGQSEITTVEGDGTLDSSVDFQAIVSGEPQTVVPLAFDELNAVSPSLTPPELSVSAEPLAFQGQFSDLKYGPLEFGIITLAEGLSIGTIPQDVLLNGTPGVISYGLGVPGFLSQYDTDSDRKTLSESSTSRDLRLPIAQGSQHKVNCIWPGCSRAIKKDNLTRHVNEVHRRKVKAVCVDCGRKFARPYMLRDHICRAEWTKS